MPKSVTGLGHSLHLQTTELINEFLATVQKEHFQYLQEILEEAKKTFGSRQVEHELLPKTPSMKRSKRKRNPKTSESDENTNPCSPQIEANPNRAKNKKQKLTESSPSSTSVLEPVNENEVLETSTQASGGRRLRPRACKSKYPARQQPARATKSSRRKIISAPEENNANESKIEKEQEKSEIEKLNTPKRSAKKQNDKRFQMPQQNGRCKSPKIVTNENKEVMFPVRDKTESSKKPKMTCTPQDKKEEAVRLCVPDTPQTLTPESQVPSSVKSCKSTFNIVLSPVVVQDSLEKEKNETFCAEEESPSELNKTGRKTEVITSCQKTPSPLNEPSQPSIEQSPIDYKASGESQGTESKKRKSSAAFNTVDSGVQIQGNGNDVGVRRDSCTVSSTTPDLGENKKARIREPSPVKVATKNNKDVKETDLVTSSQECQTVSSTVKSPEKKKRRSSRWVRKSLKSSTRRRSHLLASATKIQKSKTLVKSSVKLKLKHSRLMPALKVSSNDRTVLDDTNRMSACSVNFDGVKQDLFGAARTSASKTSSSSSEDQSANTKNNCHSSQSSDDANRSKSEEDDDDDQNKAMAAPSQSSSCKPSESHSSTSSEIYGTPKSNGTSSEDEVFEDAKDTIAQPKPSSPVHPILRRSGEIKANVLLTKVQVKASNIATIHSFIRRNTPKKVDIEHKKKRLQMQIKQKEEREKEIREKLEQQKQKELEERRRKREEKEKRAAAMRAAKAKVELEKKRQMEEKIKQLKDVDEKMKKKKELEEEAKRKLRDKKKADLDARRKQEEEARQQKLLDLAEEQRKQQELLRRKQEFEEEERKKRIAEAKRLKEQRELELERERQLEKKRILNEIEEKERRQRELHEKQEREQKLREDKEKERLEKEKKNREEREKRLKEEREEHERKRLAQLFKEKEEQERKERERRQQADRERWEKERKLHEEAIKEKRRQEEERERKRILEKKQRAEEAKRVAMLSVDSYEMTPPPPPKVRKAASAENYDITDLNSEDSTDDEDAPRKKVPVWARGPALKATMINQELMNIDTDAIFGPVSATPNLDEIFKVKRKRFYNRTSSAIWHSPPLKYLKPDIIS